MQKSSANIGQFPYSFALFYVMLHCPVQHGAVRICLTGVDPGLDLFDKDSDSVNICIFNSRLKR